MSQKRIAVAIDGSSFSEKVLQTGIQYARLHNAEIVFIHCHRKYPRILGQPHRDHLISAINDETEELVRGYLDYLTEQGIPSVERLMEGPAGSVIPEVARTENCELIVMGSRGLSNLQGLIIGSITHRVLHLAECPVLVVK